LVRDLELELGPDCWSKTKGRERGWRNLKKKKGGGGRRGE